VPLHLDDVPRSALYTSHSLGDVAALPERVWSVIESIGGDLGWYAWPAAWGVRGLLDSLAGGPGVRLARPDRQHLQPGDTVDWWTAEDVDPGRLLRLVAQTRLPGTAWLDLAVTPGITGRAHLVVTTWFLPQGLAGRIYWLGLLPAHSLVLSGLRRRIASTAEHPAPRT
jgi:Protein of unknown function (DUF2867)